MHSCLKNIEKAIPRTRMVDAAIAPVLKLMQAIGQSNIRDGYRRDEGYVMGRSRFNTFLEHDDESGKSNIWVGAEAYLNDGFQTNAHFDISYFVRGRAWSGLFDLREDSHFRGHCFSRRDRNAASRIARELGLPKGRRVMFSEKDAATKIRRLVVLLWKAERAAGAIPRKRKQR
jgi:hypothetical protein